MILLDTNVVSETWRPKPSLAVVTWLDAQPGDSLHLCTPVLAELHFGAQRLPTGSKRDRLIARIELLEKGYGDRMLSFGTAAAAAFGVIGAQRERLGRRIEPVDAMIAAIAIAHGMKLATRDTNDFTDIGLDLINPFEAIVGR
ncbi:MAG: PIN domain-containing protein [Pseudolabrys sp.]|nr:PIN domain-containing protein [Pseudolabrys sp.]